MILKCSWCQQRQNPPVSPPPTPLPPYQPKRPREFFYLKIKGQKEKHVLPCLRWQEFILSLDELTLKDCVTDPHQVGRAGVPSRPPPPPCSLGRSGQPYAVAAEAAAEMMVAPPITHISLLLLQPPAPPPTPQDTETGNSHNRVTTLSSCMIYDNNNRVKSTPRWTHKQFVSVFFCLLGSPWKRR